MEKNGFEEKYLGEPTTDNRMSMEIPDLQASLIKRLMETNMGTWLNLLENSTHEVSCSGPTNIHYGCLQSFLRGM